jgi:hypothetical protein
MFGIELLAAQAPVYSYFLGPLDARMTEEHWNRLPPGALVFDPEPSRATTVFGRFTDAAYTWFQFKPGWQALVDAPDPFALQAAGYDFLYLDQQYFDGLSPDDQQGLAGPCVQLVDEASNDTGAFRRLYDIRACR